VAATYKVPANVLYGFFDAAFSFVEEVR